MKSKFLLLILIVIFIIGIVSLYNYMNSSSVLKDNNILVDNGGEVAHVEVLIVNKANFKEQVLNYSGKVLVDFYADWCGPCRMMENTIQAIANENEDIRVVRLNVDEDGEIANQYGIINLPTFLVFDNGKVSNRLSGVIPKNTLLNAIKVNVENHKISGDA